MLGSPKPFGVHSRRNQSENDQNGWALLNVTVTAASSTRKSNAKWRNRHEASKMLWNILQWAPIVQQENHQSWLRLFDRRNTPEVGRNGPGMIGVWRVATSWAHRFSSKQRRTNTNCKMVSVCGQRIVYATNQLGFYFIIIKYALGKQNDDEEVEQT